MTRTLERSLAAFARLCSGELRGPDVPWSGISIDSRTLARGELFVALRGPNFDGHQFAAAAATAGACALVVEQPVAVNLPQVLVGDTQEALTRAGAGWRATFELPVVGVAGSNGKTTTKEMIAAILARLGPCLATRGNLNNHIGVPLTLLRIGPEHRSAVVEIGTNAPGEVAALAAIARPTVGLVTNAGAEHLEGFGSLDDVARAEGELVAALDAAHCAVLNADDPYHELWRGMTRARVLSFGLAAGSDFGAEELRAEVGPEGLRTRFRLRAPGGRAPVTLGVGGRHNVINALGAAGAASAAGASLEHIVAGLAEVRPVWGRMQFRRAPNGAWILDDCYNANPSSMRAGIETLAGLDGRRWLVVGDMAELGGHAEAAHREVGELARASGVERLFATGRLARLAADSFGSGAQWFPDTTALGEALRAASGARAPDLRLLVKGSRVNRLERVIEILLGGGAGDGAH